MAKTIPSCRILFNSLLSSMIRGRKNKQTKSNKYTVVLFMQSFWVILFYFYQSLRYFFCTLRNKDLPCKSLGKFTKPVQGIQIGWLSVTSQGIAVQFDLVNSFYAILPLIAAKWSKMFHVITIYRCLSHTENLLKGFTSYISNVIKTIIICRCSSRICSVQI